MKELVSNIVTENFSIKEVTLNSITDAAKSAEFCVDMTDCKGDVLLVVDAAASTAAITMLVYGGDYATKRADATYTITAGKRMFISISSGETMQVDGKVHLKLTATANLSTLNTTIGVYKQRLVTNY